MNSMRAVLYFVGIALVLGALWMFFMAAGLNRWIPIGIAIAALILIVGVSVMSFAETSPSDGRRVRGGNDVTVVETVDTHRHF